MLQVQKLGRSYVNFEHVVSAGQCILLFKSITSSSALIGLSWVSPVVGYLVTVLFVIVHNEATCAKFT